jgi:HWE histidine kinase
VRRGSVGRSRTVAQQTLRTAPSSKAFVETFTGRLQALAQAHNLLLAGLDRRRSWRACQGTARAVLPRRPGAAQHRGAQSNALSATSQRAWSRAARARHQRREIWRPIQWHRQGQPFVDARTRPVVLAWAEPKVRRSYPLSARGSAPSSFNAAFLTRPSIGASRPRAWSAQSIFRSPSCSPRTAAPLELAYKLT